MEPSEETPNWIPTTFSGTSETGDSVSSFQSAPVDPQSDDQSFDAISRQKLNLVGQTTPPKSSAPAPPISMFEEDTRSSWSVEPPKQTPSVDEELQNSLESPLSTSIQPFEEATGDEFKDNSPEKPHKDEYLDGAFLKPQDESQDDVFLKPHKDESQEDVFLKPLQKDSPDNVFFKPQEEESIGSPKDVSVKPESFSEELPDEHLHNNIPPMAPTEELKSNGFLEEPHEMQSPTNDIFLNSKEEQSQPNDALLEPREELTIHLKEALASETPMEEDSVKKDDGEPKAFSAESLFEYMWPQNQENGEFFVLQEQICNYLGLKSFRRKHLSTLTKRTVELEEREFLREKGVVTEVQCDLGLTALRSEEVLELMSRDYPEQYAEYIKVLREREQQSISEKHREYAASNADKTKMVDLVRRAMQSAAEYNAHLNQERREERRSCMDLQTFTIHYPKSNKAKTTPEVCTKPGKYPVALLPGQFQDYYKEYTSEELKYLPLNTVLYGPLKELQGGEEVTSESEDSSASDGSCCSSSHEDSSSESEEKGEDNDYKPKVKPNATCKVCKKGSDPISKAELVHCADCDNSAHPACIELSAEVVEVLRTYPWQCTDCKVCSQCRDPNDEDKMLFCDTCDRGYHTFCVGLKQLPTGKWVCRRCGTCSGCGATRPGEKAQWHCESGEGGRPKILCQACSKKKR